MDGYFVHSGVISAKGKAAERSVYCKSALVWNALDIGIRNIPTYELFKKDQKMKLQNRYHPSKDRSDLKLFQLPVYAVRNAYHLNVF